MAARPQKASMSDTQIQVLPWRPRPMPTSATLEAAVVQLAPPNLLPLNLLPVAQLHHLQFLQHRLL